jgi:hypothetical protein
MARLGSFAPPAESGPLRGSSIALLPVADWLLGAMVVCAGLPEGMVANVRLGEVPIAFLLFYAAMAVTLLEAFLNGCLERRWPYVLTLQVLVGGEMAVMGILGGEEWKWWVIDASMFGALVGGVLWAQQRDYAAAARIFARLGILATAVLGFNIIGLVTGAIPQTDEGDRVYSQGLFFAAGFIPIIFPFWFTDARRGHSGLPALVRALPACAGISTVFLAATVSATRSLLLLPVGSVLVTYWITSRGRMLGLVALTVFALFAWGGFLGDEMSRLRQNLLVDRLLETSLSEESRAVEVEMMFDDMETPTEYWLGKGFGSRFWSNVGTDGGGLAFAPHVAILTPWYKGGLIGFLAVIVWPLGLAAAQLLSMDADPGRKSCAAGILVYAVLASMSGGWYFLTLFPCGVFLALATRH